MRKLFAILAAGALLATGGTASAATQQVSASLSILVQGLEPITLTGTGVITITGSTYKLGPNLVLLTTNLFVPVTGTTAIDSLIALSGIGNQAGTFSMSGVTNQLPGEICPATSSMIPGPPLSATAGVGAACNGGGGIGGLMGLVGVVQVHVIDNVVVIPVNLNGARIGQGGGTPMPFTFDAAGWSTGTALVNTGVNINATAGAAPTASGQIVLVTPTFVSALGNLLPIFTTLTLTYIPEPGSLLLIGSGIAGLALLGHRRRK